ncbi:peptidylprolyl isomerase [Amnibacterium flavum]|uniref:Peptidyl-prolyl cis-trans isomerase n=1 Tax=Amnibacterium flavum TaxID=2173173 RepID=A0A2V1HSG1_9MICO|nr:peptidylprolyl isomerase [Amnibacterium flavum]
MRQITALATAGTLTLTLAACSTGDPQACTTGPDGAAADTITATGDFGSAPQIDFPTPLNSNGVQTHTLVEGDGPTAQDGQYITVDITLLKGSDGSVLQQTSYDPTSPTSFLFSGLAIPALKTGLECQPTGSRVAVTMPVGDAFPDGAPQGLTDDDTLVAVVDLVSSVTARAHGTVLPAVSGVPSVVRAPDGRPGITLTGGEAPDELKVATLIDGDGDETVAEGDSVLVQYTGVLWDGGTVFDSSWENGAPVTLAADEDSVIPGFAKAIIGKKVGSQVVAVLPPDEGYGDTEQGTIPAGSTLVFVIDILAIG